jgi:hypothetical protein
MCGRSVVADASPTSGSMDHAVEQLASYATTHPNLEGFSSQTSTFRAESEKAIASLENLEKMYTGVSELETKPFTGLTEVPGAETVVNSERAELETFYKGLSSGGSVEEAIGAETLDAAESAGIVTSSAAGVALGLVPLAGTLAYEDITTGTNFVTQAIFSSTEDKSKIEAQGGAGAEGLRWMRWPTLSASKQVSQEIQELYELKQCGSRTGCGGPAEEVYKGEKLKLSPYKPWTEGPLGTGKPDYYMEVEEGGEWYLGASGVTELGVRPSPLTEMWSFLSWPWVSGYPQSSLEPVAGYPANLRHVATSLTVQASEAYVCGGRVEPGCPGSGGNQVWQALGVRAPSRMHIGIPRIDTKVKVEKLEEEGHYFNHSTGHTPTHEQEPGTLKKFSIKLKEHGQRRQEQAECHVLECETEHVPSEPETEREPALPEKPSGEPPAIPGTLEVPDCFLLSTTGAECVKEIEEAGFVDVEIDVRTWETAVVGQPADAAISVTPAGGSRVETATKIVVDSNPKTGDMPLFVPRPNPKETGVKYAKRLEEEGWTKVETHTLTEPDSGAGPGESPYTDPRSDTRIEPSPGPGTSTTVTVDINPEGSPEPGLPFGASPSAPGCGLTPPTTSINTTPITSQRFGSVFPFVLLPWMAGTVSGIAASPTEPHFVLHVFGSEVETGDGFAPLATIFTLLRDTIAAFMWLGVAWFLWNRTIGTRMS